MKELSIRDAYAGKHIFLVGASGFLGKVWLSMLLHRLPDIGRIYILMRKNGSGSVQDRFERMMATSYSFAPLHERYGEKLSDYIQKQVEIIEGNVVRPGLGIDPTIAKRLKKNVDLVINCAGLVEFNPDIRDALDVNVDGTMHAADFAASCLNARLLHISTCFVSGARQGRIPETVNPSVAPNGKPFDPEKEYLLLRERIHEIASEEKSPRVEKELLERIREKHGNGDALPPKREKNLLDLLVRRHVRNEMIEEGKRRAANWGWTNTYCFTKGLSETLLAARHTTLSWSIFRPAIVESAISFPFPGWNEGFNTSGPLAYLLGTWFRYLPAKVGNPFDVIPVDLVANGMTIAGAALLTEQHDRVYHCGTSDRNLFTIDRACSLTSLSHRVHFRKHGTNALERLVLSQWDTVPAPPEHLLSVGNIRKAAEGVTELLNRIRRPERRSIVDQITRTSDRFEKKLNQVDKTLELFLPFIHDNRYVFTCQGLASFDLKEKEFRFAPEDLQWRDYWMNIHVPGLRKWCFPSIEGKDRPQYRPKTQFRFQTETKPTKTTTRRRNGRARIAEAS